MPCPAESHDGCPRRVIHHASGRIVAACGNHPALCESVDLHACDIEILQFDASRFTRLLAELLDLQPWHSLVSSRLSPVGDASPYAGSRIPVLLGFPTSGDPIGISDFPNPVPGERPGLLLVPRIIETVAPESWLVAPLEQVVGVGDDGKLTLLAAGQGLLDGLRSRAGGTEKTSCLLWQLPRDAKWEELRFELTSEDRLLINFRKTTKAFDPHTFRMIDGRGANQRSRSWIALGWCIEGGGRLAFADLLARFHSRNRGKERPSLSAFRKTKETLARDLQVRFGLDDDPFRTAGPQIYEARFKVCDTDPERAPARRSL